MTARAIATAVGADIDRYLNKFTKSQDAFETKANNLLSGSYFNSGDTTTGNTNNTNNSTASGINSNLNGNSSSGSSSAGNNLSLSSNALRSQNVSATGTDATSGTTGTGTGTASNLTGSSIGGGTSSQSQSYQIAAAVGLNITNHKARVNVSGSLHANAIAILADNDGNFCTLGTGAAMSLESNSNAIAAGVAVSVNNNEATITISNDTVLNASGNIAASAELTQNMNGDYRGFLGAQALAGAVSGSGGNFSIGGAIAVIVSNAKTSVTIADGTAQKHAELTGSRISITASDKSKLALRAGGISISKGASVGIGAAFALIYSNNAIAAVIGDETTVNAESLVIRAEKLRVDMSDYESAFGVDTLITDSSALTEEQRKEADTGIIDVHKGEDDSSYTVKLNISTDTVLDMIDLLNFLSSTNYYAEAIAGSIITGSTSDSKASVAGAFAIVFFMNTVDALIGDHVTINLTGKQYDVYTKDATHYYASGEDVYTLDSYGALVASDAAAADLTPLGTQYVEGLVLLATNDANVRIIGGALSAGKSTVGVGLNLGFLLNQDNVTAGVGSFSAIDAVNGGYIQNARTAADVMVITVAAAVNTSTNSTATIGGGLNAIATQNRSFAKVGAQTTIHADDDIAINAGNSMSMLFISASVSAAVSGVAVGGTIGVIVHQSEAGIEISSGTGLARTKIQSGTGSVMIAASNKETIIDIIASLSGSSQGTAVAGVLGVLITLSKTNINIGDYVSILAAKSVAITTTSDSVQVFVSFGASGSASGNAGGATIAVSMFERESKINIGNYFTARAVAGDIYIAAIARDVTVLVAFAAAASASGNALSGTIPVVVAENTAGVAIGDNADLRAGGSIALAGHLEDTVVDAAGGLVLSNGVGVGATISTAIFNNSIFANIGKNATLYASGLTAGIRTPNRAERRGVILSATSTATMVMASIAAAASAGGRSNFRRDQYACREE